MGGTEESVNSFTKALFPDYTCTYDAEFPSVVEEVKGGRYACFKDPQDRFTRVAYRGFCAECGDEVVFAVAGYQEGVVFV